MTLTSSTMVKLATAIMMFFATSAQAQTAATTDDLQKKLTSIDKQLDGLKNLQTTGAIVTIYGKDALVVTGTVATYFLMRLAKNEILSKYSGQKAQLVPKFNQFENAAAALVTFGTGTGIVTYVDSQNVAVAIENRKTESKTLQATLDKLKAIQASPEFSSQQSMKAISDKIASTMARIEAVDAEIDVFEKALLNGTDFTAHFGKQIVVGSLTAAVGLLSHGRGTTITKSLFHSLSAFTAGEAVVVMIDIAAVNARVDELHVERNSIVSALSATMRSIAR